MVWTQAGQGKAACGTCHALPPAASTGHPAVPTGLSCSACHPSVVTQSLAIIDKALHINGKADF
jgi:ferredoxin